ncbi:chaplin [Streptomyces sp. SPB162]|uniref:chaplin n=1 Tax=Streptomyces sp. SPB162 TaxID=2940560 RepID=UPI00240655B9|nr:chaplin [Streptomyces sp. SPB162]MDF9814560.1 hypothetical protein [Streptomyces sp. SPB162]
MSRFAKATVLAAFAGAAVVGASGIAFADSGAEGSAVESPGIGSGNQIQVPVDVPINLCGNSVNVIGLLNPVFGNSCDNC